MSANARVCGKGFMKGGRNSGIDDASEEGGFADGQNRLGGDGATLSRLPMASLSIRDTSDSPWWRKRPSISPRLEPMMLTVV